MKLYIIPLIMLPILAQGQTTEPDSLKVKELGEITIVADAQRTNATKTVYIPTGKQKSTSSDGVSLLSRNEQRNAKSFKRHPSDDVGDVKRFGCLK